MLFRFNAYQGSVWFTQANAVAGQVLDYEAKLLQFIHLKDLNGQLTQDILQLQQENDSMRTLLAQLTQDSSYTQKIQADLLAGEKLIPAHVISNSIKQKDNFITLDKGSKDGIRTEMGVVSGTGIVGITYLVSNHFSVVLPILNTHSNISCRLRGTNYFGSLKWSGGSPLQPCALQNWRCGGNQRFQQRIPRRNICGQSHPDKQLQGRSFLSARSTAQHRPGQDSRCMYSVKQPTGRVGFPAKTSQVIL